MTQWKKNNSKTLKKCNKNAKKAILYVYFGYKNHATFQELWDSTYLQVKLISIIIIKNVRELI